MLRVDNPHSSVRILVVDDFESWRRQICSILQAHMQFCVVAEAVDGLEALQKVRELKPDLILLDIALPNLNGLETAKRIRQADHSAKIVFVSQNDDADVVRTALSNGAEGYVFKKDVNRDLLSAVEAALRGEQFVSAGVTLARPANQKPSKKTPKLR